jgi:hypothetical protein
MQYFNIDKQINDFSERLGRLFRPRRFIGLAIEENAMLASDIRCEKGHFLVSHVNHFVFPDGASFKDPEGLGRLLGRFLQENRFGAKKAIIGIPAKWLMIREKAIPASTRENIAGILKIHAEREFSLSPEELALDYTGLVENDKPNRMFLLAMLRANLDNAILAVRWAGLDVLSVTASSIALFSRIRAGLSSPAPRYFLYIRKEYAEFLAGDGEQIVDVRYIQSDLKNETGLFVTELRRIISSYSNNSVKEGSEQLLIWNASYDLGREEFKSLEDSLPPNIRLVEGSRQSFADRLDLPEVEDAVRLAAPVMLVEAYNNTDPFYIDFLNSRMNVRTSIIKKSQVFWASAAAFGLVILLMVMFFIWRGDKKDVSELRSKLDGMKEDINDARDVIQKVSMAGGWYSKRPRILDCLTALTSAFPEEGRIWVTSLALTEEMAGVVSGRATDEKSVIEVLDQLKGNRLFSNVQMIYLQDNGRNSEEISFSMNFSYTGKE